MNKKDVYIPKVGDKVKLNDFGIRGIWGGTVGLSHLKTKVYTVTKVLSKESVTFPEATFPLEVDDAELSMMMLHNWCFDLIRRGS